VEPGSGQSREKGKSGIEAPCRKQQGIFDRKEFFLILIRSLTPPQAAGDALTFAVQLQVSLKEKIIA